MSIILDLPPQTEAQLVIQAREDGIAPAELAAKLVEDGLDLEKTKVLEKLHRWQRETATQTSPRATARELFARWDQEDAGMTSEEKQAESELWDKVQKGINGNRASLGMRRL